MFNNFLEIKKMEESEIDKKQQLCYNYLHKSVEGSCEINLI